MEDLDPAGVLRDHEVLKTVVVEIDEGGREGILLRSGDGRRDVGETKSTVVAQQPVSLGVLGDVERRRHEMPEVDEDAEIEVGVAVEVDVAGRDREHDRVLGQCDVESLGSESVAVAAIDRHAVVSGDGEVDVVVAVEIDGERAVGGDRGGQAGSGDPIDEASFFEGQERVGLSFSAADEDLAAAVAVDVEDGSARQVMGELAVPVVHEFHRNLVEDRKRRLLRNRAQGLGRVDPGAGGRHAGRHHQERSKDSKSGHRFAPGRCPPPGFRGAARVRPSRDGIWTGVTDG